MQTFCYATENKELLEQVMEDLLGEADEYSEDESVSEHGNRMAILEARLTHQRQFRRLFQNLGPDVCAWILEDIENRVDDDCMFYLRLDKQAAVLGRYEPAHHGDVIAVTGKVQAHPARKDVAVSALRGFLEDLAHSTSDPPSSDRGLFTKAHSSAMRFLTARTIMSTLPTVTVSPRTGARFSL